MNKRYYVMTMNGKVVRSDMIEQFYQKAKPINSSDKFGCKREVGIVVAGRELPVAIVHPSQTTAALNMIIGQIRYCDGGVLKPWRLVEYVEEKGIKGICDGCGEERNLFKHVEGDWFCLDCGGDKEED